MTPQRAAVTSVVVVVGGISLLLLVALWASSIGPDRALRGPGLERQTVVKSPTTTPSPSATRQSDVDRIIENPGQPSPLLKAIALVVEMLLGFAVIWLLVRGVRRVVNLWRERVRAPDRPQHVEFDVLEEPDRVREEVERDARAALGDLEDGEPRNAIVEAWDRFERSADALGLGRRPWETSSEFVLRMLAVVDADEGAVGRLEQLYREARYSSHPLGEEARAAARDALLRIQASLLVRERLR